MSARIAPAQPPFPADIQSWFDRTMPPGKLPLRLFTTLARDPRLCGKFFSAGLLERGHLTLRQREIVIDRTTARLGCEYEWGVHVAFFANRVALDTDQVAALVHGPADAPCWTQDEQALIAVVDDLVDHRTIATSTWDDLAAHFDEAQILEVIALVGYYHTISFLCRGLELPLETYAARFPLTPQSRQSAP